uniref:Uncharacterized protein n=1 Tax=Poecilia latipinna TaxID=48699 RepID=A0A3B3V1Z2_9TELE
MNRLKLISGHLSPGGSAAPLPDLRSSDCGCAAPSPEDEVVVVHGRRTAIGKAKKGSFKVDTVRENSRTRTIPDLTELTRCSNPGGPKWVLEFRHPSGGSFILKIL